MLKMAVCVKAVPDPKEACNIKIDPETKTLMRCEVPLVVNPVDRNALEAAFQLKAEYGGKVTVLSMGPPPAAEVVRECLALGAEEGILLCDPRFAGADTLATARSLAAGIAKIGPVDLVLCGMASSDGATEWVGPQIATFLEMAVVTRVEELVATDSEWWQVRAAYDNGHRLVRVKLPAVFTVTRELNQPRALSFSGIVKARRKPIRQWRVEDLGLEASQVGLQGSPTVVRALGTTDRRRQVSFIDGGREEKAEKLVEILANEGFLN